MAAATLIPMHATSAPQAEAFAAASGRQDDTAPKSGSPAPLLFLAPSTGGGHQAAASAVAEAVRCRYPGRYIPVIRDPLAGPGSARALRWAAKSYGPMIRYAPWLWGLLYRATDSPLAARLLQYTVSRLGRRLVTEMVADHQPAVVVSFHPFTGQAAIRARDEAAPAVPVVTVITDFGTPHASWTRPKADRIVPASAVGIPVGSRFVDGPLGPGERAEQLQRLGHPHAKFLILLAGGAEGAGRLARRAGALVRALPDVDIAVICGRNRRAHRRLSRLSARYGGRLSVHGFVSDMNAWLRAADLIATKAGPGTIAEAASCGTPMVLTCHLPGQESGNAGHVTHVGAGTYWPQVSQFTAGIGRLRDDTARLAGMRSAAARLARPDAAGRIAALLAELAEDRAEPDRQLVLAGGQHG